MRLFFLLILIVAAALGGYNTVYIIHEGDFGVVAEAEDNEVVSILKPGYNFVPQALFSWKVRMTIHRIKNSEIVDILVPLPGLGDLENRHYAVELKLSVTYEIDYSAIPIELAAGKGLYGKSVTKYERGNFTREISSYLYPVYDNRRLEREFNAVTEKAFAGVKQQCAAVGIRITSQNVLGTVSIPDFDIFREGMALAGEIRKIENENKKALMVLENNLQKEDYKNKKYLENLREISKLVKNNPDLLKYLYIKGFSKNVKVIIASERSGMPLGLDFEGKAGAPRAKGDIDNLR